MSIRVEITTEFVEAAPGETALVSARVHNDDNVTVRVSLRTIGFTPSVPRTNGAAPFGHPGGSPLSPPGSTVLAAARPPEVPSAVAEVAANGHIDVQVPVSVPATTGSGPHTAAIEATTDRADVRPALALLDVFVSSIDNVLLTAKPSPVRGRRRARFDLDIVNNEPERVAFGLDSQSTEVRVKFKSDRFDMATNDRASTKVKLRGPRQWSGEPTQHNIIISARRRSASTSTTVPFVQRPVFAAKAQMLLAGLVVLALWAGAIGGAWFWWQSRPEAAQEEQTVTEVDGVRLVQLRDAEGNVLDNGPYMVVGDLKVIDAAGNVLEGFTINEAGEVVDAAGNPVVGLTAVRDIVDADGNLVDGFFVDANGNVIDADGNPVPGVSIDGDGVLVNENGTPVGLPSGDPRNNTDSGDGGTGSGGTGDGAAEAPEEVQAEAPKFTEFRGTFTLIGSDDLSNARIQWTEILLSDQPSPFDDDGALRALRSEPTKIWSARAFGLTAERTPVRQTQPIAPMEAQPGIDGVWQIQDVPLRKSYEVSFSSPGYDTQTFVLTPPDDGTPVELDVVLEPGTGLISGSVVTTAGTPLGGVDVSLSDGTVAFSTTAATAGDGIGTFRFEQLNTPAVYTLVASRAGYGTEVLQLNVPADGELTGIVVVMSSGVGSIAGAVFDSNGVPLPGVTITATNGALTRSSTTLTTTTVNAGAVGSYQLPKLNRGSDYTVTAELAGYQPQTLRVPRLAGNATGVNFTMPSTTARLLGSVRSSGSAAQNIPAGPLAGAGIKLTKDNLQFQVTSDPSGNFGVAELPPGNYTITVQKADHEPKTEFRTVVAGQDGVRVDVVLDPREGGIDAGTGSLAVKVEDGATGLTDEERRVADALVIVQNIADETIRFSSADLQRDPASNDFLFPAIPVGTYRVTASKAGYNSDSRQVSLGQSQEEVTLTLVRLGSASGQVIDSITKQPLDAYAVSLFQVRENDAPLFIVRIPVPSGQDTWSTTSENRLAPGRYLARFTGPNGADRDHPSGYFIDPTQQLATDPPQPIEPNAPGLSFTIPNTAENVVTVGPVLADPYPNIEGRVYVPRLDGTQTDLDFVDNSKLLVTMECGTSGKIAADMSDERGRTNGSDDLFDTFRFPKTRVDSGGLFGPTCTLQASVDGGVLETKSTTITDVVPSNGFVLTDRFVNIAMHPLGSDLGGRVFWIDDRNGDELPLNDVAIEAEVISRFNSSESSPTGPAPEPAQEVTTIRTTSNADGIWVFDAPTQAQAEAAQAARTPVAPRQVFGPAQYRFIKEGFGVGLVDVTIDEDQNRTVVGNDRVVVNPALIDIDNDNIADPAFDVELEPPNDGQIRGVVTIRTINPTPAYDLVGIEATNSMNVVVPDTDIVRNGGSFSIDPALAGTWTVDFTPPANHLFYAGAPASVEQRLGPQGSLGGFDTTLVEQGKISVTAIDDSTGLPISGKVTLRLTGANAVEREFPNGTGAGNNVYTMDMIPVNAVNPDGIVTNYSLNVVIAGYDPTSARISIGGVTQPNLFSSAIPVGVLAGSDLAVEVRVQPFGKITVQAVGETSTTAQNGAVQPLNRTVAGRLRVTAVGTDRFGAPIPQELIGITALSVPIPPSPSQPNPPAPRDGFFEVSGPPGLYAISVEHPEYETVPTTVPFDNCNSIQCVLFPTIQRPYEMANAGNNELGGRFLLRLRRGSVNLNVVDSIDRTSPATTALYSLTLEGNTAPALAPVPGGQVTINDLIPGRYELVIRSFAPAVPPDAPVENAFPIIVTFMVERSEENQPPFVATITAPQSKIGARIVGNLRAWNVDDQPVPLPLSLVGNINITIDADFVEPTIDLDGTPLVNAETFDTRAVITPGPTADVATFALSGLPTGTHILTLGTRNNASLPSPPGYTKPTVDPVDITAIQDTPIPDIIYRVDNTEVTVEVDGVNPAEILPGLKAWLVPPGVTADPLPASAIPGTFDDTDDAGPKTITFANVPPHIDPYQLVVDTDLHAKQTVDRIVAVNTDTTNNPAPVTIDAVTLVADMARLSGTLTRNDSGDIGPLTDPDAAVLTGSLLANPLAIVPDGLGRYSVDVPVDPGTLDANYELTVELPGFTTVTVPLTLRGGRLTVQDVEIANLATFKITFTNTNLPVGLAVNIIGTGGKAAVLVGDEWVASVPAGSYQVSVTVPGRPQPIVFPDGATFITANVGTIIEKTYTIPRLLTVTTLNSDGNTTTVDVLSNNIVQATITQGGGQAFVFTSTGTNSIPLDVPLVVRVTKENKRTALYDVAAELTTTLNRTLVANAAVSGRVVLADGTTTAGNGISVKANATGFTERSSTGNTNANGEYTVNNLTNNKTDGADVLWTLTADKFRLGSGASTILIDGVTASGDLPAVNIILTPRTIPVTFTITGSETGTPAITNATITIGGVAYTPVNGVVNVPETQIVGTKIAYSASAPDYATKTGEVNGASSINAQPTENVSLDLAGLSGTVSNGSGPVVGADVLMCAGTATTPCAAGSTPTDTSIAGGVYTLDLAAKLTPSSTYRIEATKTANNRTEAGFSILTVGADRSYDATDLDIVMGIVGLDGTIKGASGANAAANLTFCAGTTACPGGSQTLPSGTDGKYTLDLSTPLAASTSYRLEARRSTAGTTEFNFITIQVGATGAITSPANFDFGMGWVALKGKISNAAGAVIGATVVICEKSGTDPCPAGTTPTATSMATDGSYTLSFGQNFLTATTTYRIQADFGTGATAETNFKDVTVNGSKALSISNFDITIS